MTDKTDGPDYYEIQDEKPYIVQDITSIEKAKENRKTIAFRLAAIISATTIFFALFSSYTLISKALESPSKTSDTSPSPTVRQFIVDQELPTQAGEKPVINIIAKDSKTSSPTTTDPMSIMGYIIILIISILAVGLSIIISLINTSIKEKEEEKSGKLIPDIEDNAGITTPLVEVLKQLIEVLKK